MTSVAAVGASSSPVALCGRCVRTVSAGVVHVSATGSLATVGVRYCLADAATSSSSVGGPVSSVTVPMCMLGTDVFGKCVLLLSA